MQKFMTGGVLAAIAFAALLSGCGSSNDNKGGVKTISKAEYVKKANALCKPVIAQINRETNGPAVRPLADPTSATPTQLKAVAPLLAKVATQTKDLATRIAKLGRPDSDADKYAKILSDVGLAVAQYQTAAQAAAAGEGATVKNALNAGEKISQESDRLSKQAGLTVCAG